MTDSGESSNTLDISMLFALQRLLLGYRFSLSLCAAAKLGIADLLRDGPRDVDDLAHASEAHPDGLRRLLRALASVGVFAEDSRGAFRLTPLADMLRTDAPASARKFAIAIGETWWWRAWEGLLYGVKTGKPSFDHVHGISFFDYFARHREAAATFDAIMSERTRVVAQAMAVAYDFSGIDTVVERRGRQWDPLGGRSEGVSASARHPVRPARRRSRRGALPGARGHSELLSNPRRRFLRVRSGRRGCLHPQIHPAHWDDERAIAILKNCHRSMRDRGRLLLVEAVAQPSPDPDTALPDLNMLVLLTGRERTAEEYRTLLEAAGFAMTRVIPTQSPCSIVEALCRNRQC